MMAFRNLPGHALLALVLLVLPLAGADADEDVSPEAARTFIADLSKEAIETLTNTEKSREERDQEIRAMMREHLDLGFIGRFVLGRTWRTANDEQKDAYDKLFAIHILQTYSRLLGGYDGQRLTVGKARSAGRGDALVEATIEGSNQEPVVTAWRVRNTDDGLRVIDVMVEGVSMAQTKREEFAQIVRKDGIDGLIGILETRTESYEGRG